MVDTKNQLNQIQYKISNCTCALFFWIWSHAWLSIFFKIADYLRKLGCEVYTPAVSATNTPKERDEQLLAEVRKILRKSGAEKVNLIGHC